ncbi:hypothetical protein [Gallibacterium sp. ZY190522]
MEKMKTGIIKFNIKDIGRKHTGKPRNFDVGRIVKAINDPAFQEQVRLGEVTGFYSHLPRIKYGLGVKDAVYDGDKLIALDPCFKTTYIKALDDGTIEHEAEFYDNEYGRKAFYLLQQNTGGFSSAIAQKNNGDYIFYGFDYVRSPNFAKNRPYSPIFDDISTQEYDENAILWMDDISTEELMNEERLFLLDHIQHIESINEDLKKQYQLLLDASENLTNQNQALLDETVSLKLELENKYKNNRFSTERLDEVKKQAAIFDNADIVLENDGNATKEIDAEKTKSVGSLLKRFF